MTQKVDELIEDWVTSVPSVYVKLKQVLDDPESSFKDFARIINTDPALTARLLKIVNSPFYGYSEQIETVTHALNIIGTEQLSQLVLATTIKEQFGDVPRYLVNMDSFWRHSIACGVASRVLAKMMKEKSLDTYYVAGMLHDIGSLVIYKKVPQKAKAILARVKDNGENIFDVEREVLGMTHAAVGARLLRTWKLPTRLIEPVLFHHSPHLAKEFPLATALVYLADGVACQLKLGNSGEIHVPPFNPAILSSLGLREDFVREIQDTVKDQYYENLSVFL